MKRNVDLTLNRDFYTPHKDNLLYELLQRVEEPILNEYDLCKPELVLTGNEKERSSKKRHSLFYADYVCDRCGENRRFKFLLSGSTRLCNKCSKELCEQVNPSVWWKRKKS